MSIPAHRQNEYTGQTLKPKAKGASLPVFSDFRSFLSRHYVKTGCLVLLVAGAIATVSPAAAAPDPYVEFLAKYRCEVADRLQRVFEAGDPSVERDRYLVLAAGTRDQSYVQCLFHNNNTMVYCEAASGFFVGEPRTIWLPPAKITALSALGFSTDDTAGNFTLDMPFKAPHDFGSLADLMLRALYVGYDARIDQPIEVKAPFAPRSTTACDLMG